MRGTQEMTEINFNEIVPELLQLRTAGKTLISGTAKNLAAYGRSCPGDGKLLELLHADLTALNVRLDDIFKDVVGQDGTAVNVDMDVYFHLIEIGELYQAWADDFATVVNPIEESILSRTQEDPSND